jgi:hypothetical protein
MSIMNVKYGSACREIAMAYFEVGSHSFPVGTEKTHGIRIRETGLRPNNRTQDLSNTK